MQEAQASLKEIDKVMVTIQNFSENFRTAYQDEPQSAHYSYEQASLLCNVSYYKCQCSDSCSEVAEKSTVIISPDLIHDVDFVTASDALLASEKKSLGIEKEIVFTDGAGSQFKNIKMFSRLQDQPRETTREYFETSHGKSECDALGGYVKNKAKQIVAAGTEILQNAKDLFNFCKQTLEIKTEHKERRFLYLPKLTRVEVTATSKKLQSVPETRKLHSIRPSGIQNELAY